MRRAARWALAACALAGTGALLFWGFRGIIEEREREDEAEHPVESARRALRDGDGNVFVTLDRGAQQRIGLVVRTLDQAERLPQVRAYGRVLDPAPLVEDCGSMATLTAALAGSRAEYDRVKALHEADQNVSRRALEAAEAHFRSDEIRLRTSERLFAGRWGTAVAGFTAVEREAFVDRLVARKAALVLVHLPFDEPVAGLPSGATIVPALARESQSRAEAIFAAPAVDQKFQGPSFLLLVDSPSAFLIPGASVVAHLELPGTARKGVVVPGSAVVRFERTSWIYLQDGDERFLRREITLEDLSGEGWFLTGGVGPGDRVVVTGAQALLSEEMRSRIRLEEE